MEEAPGHWEPRGKVEQAGGDVSLPGEESGPALRCQVQRPEPRLVSGPQGAAVESGLGWPQGPEDRRGGTAGTARCRGSEPEGGVSQSSRAKVAVVPAEATTAQLPQRDRRWRWPQREGRACALGPPLRWRCAGDAGGAWTAEGQFRRLGTSWPSARPRSRGPLGNTGEG